MQSDDPPFLSVGTEVSAKFKGAFCEAKVKRMTKSVKCKVQLKTPPYGTIFADHTEIKGPLEINQQVEITQGKATYKGVIQNIKDNSIYVVVFNDGDERQLRRTQVCIKGAKHFNEDVNLDSMPLYKPESFSHPVVVEDRRQTRKRRKLGRSKQRREQQSTAVVSVVEGDDDDDDGTRSDDRSTPESNTSSTATITTSTTSSNSNTTNSSTNEPLDTMTVATPAVTGRTRRTRQPISKLAMPRRLRSTRAAHAQSSKQSDNSDRDLRNDDVGDDDDNNNSNGSGPVRSRMRRFTHPPKPSASRMIADKILTKSIARTRKKRYAAAAATDALKRIKELSGGDGKRRIGGEDDDDDEDDNESYSEVRSDGDDVGGDDDDEDVDEDDDGDDDDDDDDDNDDDDDDGGVGDGADDADRGKGRTRARKKHCSSDEDDDKTHANEKVMDGTSVTSSNRKSERKRQVVRDKVTEPAAKKLPEEANDTRKLYKVGSVIAMFDSSTRRGRWTPVVVVSEEAFKNATKGALSTEHNEPFLRSFRDGKYLTCTLDKLSSPGTVVLRYPEAVSKAALDRATAFAENDVLPMGWEKSHIYGEDARPKKSDRRSPSADTKKRSETSEKGKQEKEKTKASVVESSSMESESSTEEEYGEERDQFTAQLYKFHEERGTPINRAPILGGKDIDMFRLYNVVQGFGGKKRVTENNQWKLVLRKMHLEGCPGATPATVKNAYSRYLDHFNSFYRSLGISSWLTASTPSTSSRSERPTRLLDRHNIKLQRKRWELLTAKKKEKAQKESAAKARTTKREKDESAAHTKREKAKKEERNVTKSDISEDDDKGKAAPSISSQRSTPLPGIKRKSKIKDEEEQDKGSVSESETIEISKEKGVVKDEKESTKGRPRGPRKKDKEKDANRDEEQQHSVSKATDIDKRLKSIRANKPEPKSFGEGGKRKSPSIASTASNVDQGISGSDDDARSRQIRLKEARKFTTAPIRSSADHKEASVSKREESVAGKDSDSSHASKKEKNKEGIVPWANCCPATILTQFYMGQNIKAYHHGQWYDARVITLGSFSQQDVLSSMMDFEARCKAINESNECDEKERNEALTAATARLNDRLESILRERICCVHYLGWNSRYDEWVALIKIKVHEKDQKASVEQFLSIASDKLSAPTLEAAVAWRSSVDPTRLLAAEGSSGMRMRKVEEGGRVRKRRRRKMCYFDEYVQRNKKTKKKKPRRLSHTHERSESRSRSTTISEKKVKKSKTPQISLVNASAMETSNDMVVEPSPAIVTAPAESDTDIVLRRLPDEATVSEAPPELSFASEVVSSTIYANGPAEDKSEEVSNLNGQLAMTEICSVSISISRDPSKERSSAVPESADSEVAAQETVEEIKTEETEQSAIPVAEPMSELVDTGETKEPEVDQESAAKETGKDDENLNSSVTVLDETKAVKEEDHKDKSERQNLEELTILTRSIELESGKDIENREQPQIASTEVAVEKTVSPCRESVSVESEAAAEDTTSKECDDDAWHPPMSLSLKQRGRGMKKKKIGKVASNTMAERKGPGKGSKRMNNEEQSKESEECSSTDEESIPSVRDSWHALKVRMQQKIEMEGAMAHAEEELNLEPIDSSLTGEALINKLQERMQELREIYHSIRSDQARLDRRWRKTLERKNEEKELQGKKSTDRE